MFGDGSGGNGRNEPAPLTAIRGSPSHSSATTSSPPSGITAWSHCTRRDGERFDRPCGWRILVLTPGTEASRTSRAALSRHPELEDPTEFRKWASLRRVTEFKEAHADEAAEALARLKEAALAGDNVFAVLMDAARVCTLQQVTEAFFEVGGQYRRNV